MREGPSICVLSLVRLSCNEGGELMILSVMYMALPSISQPTSLTFVDNVNVCVLGCANPSLDSWLGVPMVLLGMSWERYISVSYTHLTLPTKRIV